MNFELSVETVIAADILRAMIDNNEEIALYKVLSDAIGKDAQRDGYSHIYSARRIVEKERSCVLIAVPGVGIKEAVPVEVINIMGSGLDHAARTHRKTMRRGITLAPVEKQEGLSQDAKRLYLSRLQRTAIYLHFERPSSIKKLNTVIAKNELGTIVKVQTLLEEFVGQPREQQRAKDTPAHIEAPGS